MAVAVPTISGASKTTAGGSLVINKPTGVAAGDFLVCYIICSANTVITPPSDTVPWDTDVSAAGIRSYSKIAGASEPASYTFTRASDLNNIMGVICRVTGAHATSPKQTFGSASGGSGTTVTLPTLTVTDGFTLLQIAESQANTSFTPPAGPTELFDQTFATQNYTAAVGLETVGAGATGTRVWTAGASAVRAGVMYAIKAATQTVSPGGVDSSATVGSPSVTAGPVTVSPGGISSTATVGTPTVTAGTATVSPGGIDSAATLGTPTVTAGGVTVSPTGIDSAGSVGTPTVVPGTITVSPTGVDSTATVGTPSVTAGTFTVEPSGIDSTTSLGTPTVTAGGFTVSPEGIGPDTTVGTPTVQKQPVVSGTVFNHETGDPVPSGVVVKLFDDNDLLVDTTVTDASGAYVFFRPFGDTDTYWVLAEYEISGVQYHGVSDRGCAAE